MITRCFQTAFLCCFVLLGFGQDNAFLTSPDSLDSDRDRAHWYLNTLKNEGCLVVRLPKDSLRIMAYRQAGKQRVARRLEKQAKERNEALMQSFNKVFTYCPVYFIEAVDYKKIQKGSRKGIFLNEFMEVDTSIILKEPLVLFCDRGTAYMPLVVSSDDARTKASSSTPASNDALVVKDVYLKQLQPPFPAYVGVRGKTPDKAVNLLNKRLHKRIEGPMTIKFSLQQIDYGQALDMQREHFKRMLADKQQGHQPQQKLMLCEHQPVYTLGKRADQDNILLSPELLNADVFRIQRGGDVTFHGPGQITGYPLLDLEQQGIGLREYIHRLEQVVIDFIAEYGIKGSRLDGASGVWIDPGVKGKERKICAIGVKASRFVTMHGFALNVKTDLSWFTKINPCGFSDKSTTSMQQECNTIFNMQEVAKDFERCFTSYFTL